MGKGDMKSGKVEIHSQSISFKLVGEVTVSKNKEFDIANRAAQKAASRAEDERRLRDGEVTREELQRENSHGLDKLFRGAPWTVTLSDGSKRRISPHPKKTREDGRKKID